MQNVEGSLLQHTVSSLTDFIRFSASLAEAAYHLMTLLRDRRKSKYANRNFCVEVTRWKNAGLVLHSLLRTVHCAQRAAIFFGVGAPRNVRRAGSSRGRTAIFRTESKQGKVKVGGQRKESAPEKERARER
jgi:hypothetical protein